MEDLTVDLQRPLLPETPPNLYKVRYVQSKGNLAALSAGEQGECIFSPDPAADPLPSPHPSADQGTS